MSRGGMIDVSEIADRLNGRAVELCAQLLPNGHRAGNNWMASGIADTGKGTSLVVNLSGSRIGQWHDFGNCPADEQSGDMIDLLRHVRFGGDKKAAIQEAKRILGIVDEFTPRDAPKPSQAELDARAKEARLRAERREAEERAAVTQRIKGARALFLHANSKPIAGTPAAAYLAGRGIDVDRLGHWPNSLRFNAEVWNRECGVKMPAMLAMMVDAQGQHRATHRTYLDRDRFGAWVKASATGCGVTAGGTKMVLGPSGGCFVPLRKGSSGKSMREIAPNEPVYVTEGIEDALTVAMCLPAARVICGYSLGNMGAIVLPEAAQRLVIVADRDEKMAEVDKLERSIARQQARGLQVATVMPPKGIKDFNQWLLEGLKRGAAA